MTALTIFDAVRRNDVEEVSRLLARWPRQGHRRLSALGNKTALMVAAELGHTACVEVLVPLSDPLAEGPEHKTALMFAVEHQHLACARLLAPHSNPVGDARNTLSSCAVVLAINPAQPAMMQLLLASVSPAQSQKVLYLFERFIGVGYYRTLVNQPAFLECLDAFAPFVPLSLARPYLTMPRPLDLPHFRARLEQESLREALGSTASVEEPPLGGDWVETSESVATPDPVDSGTPDDAKDLNNATPQPGRLRRL